MSRRRNKSCNDIQVVHISGPKGGQTVEVIRKFRCTKPKNHSGDHKDHGECVVWEPGTESPTKIKVQTATKYSPLALP